MLHRIFSAQSYPTGIKYNLNFIKHIAELALGKISYPEFTERTKITFQDFIISKDHVGLGLCR